MPELHKRIRDPVHGLIKFDLRDEVDRTAYQLIDTPEFQRLRRVKQLGVSEFTFPGATHSRFAHSIGVFHLARHLLRLAEDRLKSIGRWNDNRRRVALLAALLHDLGHGPFSHAFEEAEKIRLVGREGVFKNHEKWTAEIIAARGGGVRGVLTERFSGDGWMADEIATLLTSEPEDIYSAVVSSSFDADRLDYLQRDKLMTGSGAGSIDFAWLSDNLRIANVQNQAEGGDVPENGIPKIETFCFAEKAVQAAEAFILARYHLYTQVYYHKTTRGAEQLLSAFLAAFAKDVAEGRIAAYGLADSNPLVAYYKDDVPSLEHYLALDDAVIWNAIERCAPFIQNKAGLLAKRLKNRELMKAIEINTSNPTAKDKVWKQHIDDVMEQKIGIEVFKDRAPLSVYKVERRETVKPHKRVHILRNDDSVVDLAALSPTVRALTSDHEVLRYYFLNEEERQAVMARG